MESVIEGGGRIYLSREGRTERREFAQLVSISKTYDLALIKTVESGRQFLGLAGVDEFDHQEEHLLYTLGYPSAQFLGLEQAGPTHKYDDTFYEIIFDKEDYDGNTKGISGSPIIDSRGRVVAVLFLNGVNTNEYYGVAVKYVHRLIAEQVGVTCFPREWEHECMARAHKKMEYLADVEKDPIAQYQSGTWGEEFDVDRLRQSANAGSFMARRALCMSYNIDGEHDGIPKNELEAFRWCNYMDTKSPRGSFELAWIYYKAKEGRRNLKEAARLFRWSAEQGFSVSQYYMGVLYYYGRGVVKDRRQSEVWFRKAAQNGNKKAESVLRKFFSR